MIRLVSALTGEYDDHMQELLNRFQRLNVTPYNINNVRY